MKQNHQQGSIASAPRWFDGVRFWLFIVAACLSFQPISAAQPSLIGQIDAIGMTVSNLDRAVAFYRDVLSFEPVSEVEVAGPPYEHLFGVFGLRLRRVQMRLGDENIELIHYLAPTGRPIPVDSRAHDRWFQHIALIVRDMDQAYHWLRTHQVQQASPGPQRLPDWNPNAGGIEAFYFRDPDGHPLEILKFPKGKGRAKWHAKSDKLFLGIDHTAIVVANTEQSLGFYRDQLGLRVAGESENYGPEQERLNNVFGARLRITALTSDKGPGIELLEYLAPQTGRPMPPDTQANDLWHWQIRVSTHLLPQVEKAVSAAQGRLVSPATVRLTTTELGFSAGMMVRDPDGHALLFTER